MFRIGLGDDRDVVLVVVGNQSMPVSKTGERIVPQDRTVGTIESVELAFGMGDNERVLNHQVGQPTAFEVGFPNDASRSFVETNDVALHADIKLIVHSGGEDDGVLLWKPL